MRFRAESRVQDGIQSAMFGGSEEGVGASGCPAKRGGGEEWRTPEPERKRERTHMGCFEFVLPEGNSAPGSNSVWCPSGPGSRVDHSTFAPEEVEGRDGGEEMEADAGAGAVAFNGRGMGATRERGFAGSQTGRVFWREPLSGFVGSLRGSQHCFLWVERGSSF